MLTISEPKLLQFMAAGHDTATITLSWSFYTLATRQDLQDKLRTEIFDLLDRTSGSQPLFSAVDDLKFLDMFVKEVLRMYPPGEWLCT